ncbi:Nitroreductase [Hexamita inflata]|uniref:Nitroreductase n=1 Tax=Hexamita inflata TaxID=28002 RepID=A0AA86TAN1_9EUKA|nr:Nitroreductase [Hexamita inflata]
MSVQITSDCILCGTCVSTCPSNALTLTDGRILYTEDDCMHCGQCFAVCPARAIRMFDCDPSIEFSPEYRKNVEICIQMRRSVRKFLPAPIDHETLLNLLNETRFAPSAKNQRAVQFVVLGRHVLDEVAHLVAQIIWANPIYKKESVEKDDVVFRSAPQCVLAIAPKTAGTEDGIIALSTFELLAQSQNIGTFWCGFLRRGIEASEEIRKILGLPDELQVVAAMGVGHPDEDFKRPAARKPVPLQFVD